MINFYEKGNGVIDLKQYRIALSLSQSLWELFRLLETMWAKFNITRNGIQLQAIPIYESPLVL